MNSLYVKITKLEGEAQKISLEGSIDENSNFHQFNFPISTNVILDLEKVLSINVHGIRKWIEWVYNTLSRSSITLIHCPSCVVDQINSFEKFLPSHVVIESFYVPYYSHKFLCERNILFQRGKEFQEGKVSPPDLLEREDGEDMEIDVVEEEYFAFIFKKTKKESVN